MAKKLHYFELNGLAESIRYILHYGGQNFEDIRYPYSFDPEIWPPKGLGEILPYGQIPIYEEGDKKLNQSLAIARYLGAQLNLVPSDLWEQAILDAAVHNIYDFWGKIVVFVKENDVDKKEALKKVILNESIDYLFSRIEKELKENNGFFSKKLSWADFVFLGVLESANLFLGIEIEDNYPSVKALVHYIRALPGVKEYIKSRVPYVLNF